jgi:hypothetical protein
MPYMKMRKLEQEKGDLHSVIIPLVNEVGQIETGRRLGISSTSISKWLKRNGYEAKIMYVRREQVRSI